MGKNFRDIYGDTYVALPAGFGIEGGFPIDLRTVLPGTTMLENLIHNGMVYEGMLVYINGTIYICKPKFHSAIWNADGDIAASKDKYYLDEQLTQPITDDIASGTTVYSNMLWYEEYEVTAQQVEASSETAKLDHTVVINGKATNFALPEGENVTTIDTGLFTPETIAAGTDIDTITHCGHYSYTDANSANNYSLLIQKIGQNLYRTKISMENGLPVIETSVQTGSSGGVVTWSAWQRLSVGKSITTATSQNLHASSVGGNHVALDIIIGSTPELWVYSDSSANYPAGYPNIQTADGQVFTIGSQSSIAHPFLIKLVNDNGTRTATVESLKANGSNFGMVKLNDAINVDKGVGYGEAATPKAVRSVQANLTDHSGVKGNSSTYGHVALSDATNSTSDASANIAATPKAVKAVKDAVDAEESARATTVSNEATARQNADTALQNNITAEATARANADSGLSGRLTAVETKIAHFPLRLIAMWTGSTIPNGWALCDGGLHNGYRTPDLRDKFVVGSGNSYSVGNTGGEDTVTLTTAQMPKHKHYVSGPKDRIGNPNGALDSQESISQLSDDEANKRSYWRGNRALNYGAGMSTNLQCTEAGNSQPHENRPPYYALAFIMYVGE